MLINSYRFASGSVFDPLSLSPALWLDFSDASTLYDATSGGSLVAADGAIARVNDKSGNSRHATQSTSGARPIRKTGIQNGKDVGRFDGAGDNMTHGLTGSVTNCTIICVVKRLSAPAGSYRGIIAIGPNSSSGSMMLGRFIGNSRWGTYSSSDQVATTDPGTSSFRIFSMVDNAGSGGSFFLDGTADGTWAGNSLGQDQAHIGGSVPSNQTSNIDIAEILVFPTALSTTNRQAVEAYLNAKYAIY